MRPASIASKVWPAVVRRAERRFSTSDGYRLPPWSAFNDTIRTRLLLLAVAATLPLLVMEAITAAQDLSTARRDAQAEALRVAQLHANLLDEHVLAVDTLLRAVSPAVGAANGDAERQTQLLQAALAELPLLYTDLYLSPAPPGLSAPSRASPLERTEFSDATAEEGLLRGPRPVSPSEGVVLARPVMDLHGSVVALINSASRLDRLPRLDTRDVPAGTVIIVFDERGVVLAHSPQYDAWVGRDLSDLPLVNEALAVRQGSGELTSPDGVLRLSAYTTATRVPWLVYVGLPSEIVLGSSRVAVLRNLWFGVLALGLALFVAWIIAGRITAPLRRLAGDAAALGQGDLDRRTTVDTHDEVGVLAAAFNRMAAAVQGYVEDVRESHQREQQARLVAERASHQLRDLQTVTDTALAHRSLDDLLRELLFRVRDVLAGEAAAILLWSADDERLVVRASIGPTVDGLPWLAELAQGKAESPLVREDEQRTLLGARMHVEERGIGVVLVAADRARSFSDEDAQLLQLAADRMALAIEHAHLNGQIAAREAQLSDLVGRLQIAQEEERRRVAYEVHDGLAQVAASAHQHLQTFAYVYPPTSEAAREALRTTVDLVQRTVREARRVIAGLRPTALDDFGLATAIQLEVEALRAEGWEVHYEQRLGDERLAATLETALYRVAQEALTNIRKHAGRTRVAVGLERHQHGVRLEVRDWGRGFVSKGAHETSRPGERVGLLGMRERVVLLGGKLEIKSKPGAGTHMTAEVPLAAAAREEAPRGV
jgi:signal transduction histidine kinase